MTEAMKKKINFQKGKINLGVAGGRESNFATVVQVNLGVGNINPGTRTLR